MCIANINFPYNIVLSITIPKNIRNYSYNEFCNFIEKYKDEIEISIIKADIYLYNRPCEERKEFIEFLRRNYKNYDIVKVML